MNRFPHCSEESLPPFERESILDTKEETESETKKNIVFKMAIGGFREKAKEKFTVRKKLNKSIREELRCLSPN